MSIHSVLKVTASSLISALLLLSAPTAYTSDLRPATVIYKTLEQASAQDLKSLNALLHSQGLVQERHLNGSGITIATFEHPGREQAVANILRHSGYVQFAEPDYAFAPNLQPNDNLYSIQWHHQTLNSAAAWEMTQGASSVLVGVCDTGFDVTHPDLIGNLRTDLAYNAQDGSNYIYDANGHGTGTSGTLGAVGNNAIGVAGVNWNVGIIPVRIAISDTNSSAYISTMANCIEYAADHGARVVNLSYGGISSSTIDAAAQYLRSKNGLLFMSAGNDGSEFSTYPDFTSFIGVGATDKNNDKASFSNWGTYVDITAPGVEIATTYPNNSYIYYSGTSFSSPITAGVAALMVAANPSITPQQIEQGLFSTATDIGASGDDNVFGHGLVNAQAAVEYAMNLASQFPPTAVISSNQDSLPFGTAFEFNAGQSSDSDGNIVSYQWNFGDGTGSNLAAVSHNYAQAGAYQVSLSVTDNDGLSDSTSVIVQVTNQLPSVQIQTDATSGLAPLTINFSADGSNDTDGQIVGYDWNFGDGSAAQGSSVSHQYTRVGNYTTTLTLTDNAGGQNSASVQIQVIDPYQIIAPSNLLADVNNQTVTLSWQDNSVNESEFRVERASKVRGKYVFETIAQLSADSTAYVDAGLSLGTYQYRITAGNDYSSASSEAILVNVDTLSSEPPAPPPADLAAPTNLTAAINGSDVALSWSDNSDNETGFVLERTEKVKGASLIVTFNINADQTSFNDNPGSGSFSYRIQAINANSRSDFSNSVSVRLR